ncbi:MAG TPA: hypothetical protein VFH61_15875 [Thermoleophilia bacterium]|nr:hypothetical protein [Thermoleophilia bacterium]
MTMTDFMRLPTEAQWQWARVAGWPGPDGSSSSTDHIMGVRIGITSGDWNSLQYAANRHDWRYFLGRLMGLGGDFRAEADRAYRDDCISAVRAALSGWKLAVAVARCHARYAGLRVGARFAWTQAQRLTNLQWAPAFPAA